MVQSARKDTVFADEARHIAEEAVAGAGLDTRLDTPPSIKRRHPDSGILSRVRRR
jgi:hypothetical protein